MGGGGGGNYKEFFFPKERELLMAVVPRVDTPCWERAAGIQSLSSRAKLF